MLKTICYRSNLKSNLLILDKESLFDETKKSSIKNNIVGVLTFHESAFFQIIEGLSSVIVDIYNKIKKDSKHKEFFEILNQPIEKLTFNNYDTVIV